MFRDQLARKLTLVSADAEISHPGQSQGPEGRINDEDAENGDPHGHPDTPGSGPTH